GIPGGPPLHRDGHNEYHEGHVPVAVKVGQQVEVMQHRLAVRGGDRAREFLEHDTQAADQFEGGISGSNHRVNVHEELDHVNPQHSLQAGVGGEHDVEQTHH